jgi:hypothetical protein
MKLGEQRMERKEDKEKDGKARRTEKGEKRGQGKGR